MAGTADVNSDGLGANNISISPLMLSSTTNALTTASSIGSTGDMAPPVVTVAGKTSTEIEDVEEQKGHTESEGFAGCSSPVAIGVICAFVIAAVVLAGVFYYFLVRMIIAK